LDLFFINTRNIERFSNGCREANTEVITRTNHNTSKQRDEPIRIPSNYLKLAQSAGLVLVFVSGCLLEKPAQHFLARNYYRQVFENSSYENKLCFYLSFRLMLPGDNFSTDLPIIEPDEWEVEYTNLAFGKQIGEGAFGTVSKATITGLPGLPPQKEVVAAVKKLKRKEKLATRHVNSI